MNDTLDIYHRYVKKPLVNDIEISSAAKKSLDVINYLPQSEIFHPFLLKLALDFDFDMPTHRKDYELILETVETFSVRHMFCATLEKSDVEDVVAQAIQGFGQKQRSIHELLEYLKREMPSDTEFKNSFSEYSFKKGNTNILKALLRRLEVTYNKGKVEELSENLRDIQLEHIMPIKIKNVRGWSDVSGYHDKYLWWMGNLTLLAKKLNTGNRTFHYKTTKQYIHSRVTMTRQLTRHKAWNRKLIRARQKQMAEVAVATWPRKSK
jgi:hypothetical protein